MAGTKTEPRKSERTKRQILSGAAEAFAEKGYYGTTTRAISESCGMEQSSIYHYFGDKENLFRLTLFYTHTEIKQFIESKIDREGDLKQELISIFNSILHYHKKTPHMIHLVFSLVYSAPGNITQEYTSLYGSDFRRMIEAAFRRTPPGNHVSERLSLMIDLLYSYLLGLSAMGTRNDRVIKVKRSMHFILDAKIPSR